MKPGEYLRKGKVFLWKETFAIVKSKKVDYYAFANIVDKNEITLIVDQTRINLKNVIRMDRDWKMFTFDMVLPFELVGFIATVSKALAAEGIGIFTVSAFSTDHILVKKKDALKAKKKLESLGCVVQDR